MRETIIIIVILIVIIGGAIFIKKYLDESGSKIVSKLQRLEEKINSNQDSNDIEEIIKDANEVYEDWQKTEDIWAIIVLHSELDSIETAFIRMKTNLEKGELAESIEGLETAVFLVKHISDTEKFCIKNIF